MISPQGEFNRKIQMNQDIAKRWSDALRSGEYEQGYSYLCSVDIRYIGDEIVSTPSAYCCLGVLCELAVKAGVVEGRQTDTGYRYGTADDFDKFHAESGILPEAVRVWADINDYNPTFSTDDGTHSAAYLNDKMNCKFPEIADLIDEQWERL